MKILHVCSNYYPAFGGPQYTMKHLSEKLSSYYADEVEVVTTDSYYGPEMSLYKKITPSSEILKGVLVKRFSFRRWHYPLIKYAGKVYGKIFKRTLPYSILRLRWELDSPTMIEAINDADAEVIMATTSNYYFNDYPNWRFNTAKPKPFVLYGAIHLHRQLTEDSPILQRAKICDCYISNTEFERQELIKYGVDGKKIITIGTGVSIEDFNCSKEEIQLFKNRHFIHENDVVIGHVGRLSKGKGVLLLLDSFRKLSKKYNHIKLLLAGTSTDLVPQLKKIINQENLPVILVEDFCNEDKPVLFHVLDIFVLASQSESFGVVFLEAWACKKPILTVRMGATASLLNDGTDSLLFSLGETSDFAKKMEYLIINADERNRLGQNGFIKVKEKFTWEKIVEAYRNAYLFAIENFNKVKAESILKYPNDQA